MILSNQESLNNTLYCVGYMSSNQKDSHGQAIMIHPEALARVKKCPIMLEHGQTSIGEKILGYVNFMAYAPTITSLTDIRTKKIKIVVGFTLFDKDIISQVKNGEIRGLSAKWRSKNGGTWVNATSGLIMDEEIDLIELTLTTNPANSDAVFKVADKQTLLDYYGQADHQLERVKSDNIVLVDEDKTYLVSKSGVREFDSIRQKSLSAIMSYDEIKEMFNLDGEGSIVINPDGTATLQAMDLPEIAEAETKEPVVTETPDLEAELEKSSYEKQPEIEKSMDKTNPEVSSEVPIIDSTDSETKEEVKGAEPEPKKEEVREKSAYTNSDYIDYIASI